MNRKISMMEMLKLLDSKQELSELVFVTADEKRGTGGDLVTLKNCVQYGNYDGDGTYPALEKVSHGDYNPNHWTNQTRNIKILQSGKLRKVHIHLIRKVNGMQVL